MSKRGNIVVYSLLHEDFGPFLADKIGIVFETSKPKIASSQFLFGKHLSPLETSSETQGGLVSSIILPVA